MVSLGIKRINSMMKMLSPIGLALILASLLSPLAVHADDAEAIRNVFASLKSDLLSGNTVKAANALAPSVASYYEQLKPFAINRSAPLPANMPVVDHLVVEILRQRAGTNLANLHIADIATEGIRNGWIKLDGLNDIQLGAITVNGSNATGALIIKNTPSSWSLPFLKSGGDWKLDPLAFYNIGDLLLKTEIARNGFNEKKTVDSIVASLPTKKKS